MPKGSSRKGTGRKSKRDEIKTTYLGALCVDAAIKIMEAKPFKKKKDLEKQKELNRQQEVVMSKVLPKMFPQKFEDVRTTSWELTLIKLIKDANANKDIRAILVKRTEHPALDRFMAS